MDPIDNLIKMIEEANRSLANFAGGISTWQPLGFLGNIRLDVVDRGDHYEIYADLPGVRKEDINITTNNGVLTISAKAYEEKEEERENYVRRERSSREYYRRVPLPDNANLDIITAKYSNGVLFISIPKKEGERKKKIEVE